MMEAESLTYAKVVQCELERKEKPDEQKVDDMFDEATSGHTSFGSSYFLDFQIGKRLSETREVVPVALTPKEQTRRRPRPHQRPTIPTVCFYFYFV